METAAIERAKRLEALRQGDAYKQESISLDVNIMPFDSTDPTSSNINDASIYDRKSLPENNEGDSSLISDSFSNKNLSNDSTAEAIAQKIVQSVVDSTLQESYEHLKGRRVEPAIEDQITELVPKKLHQDLKDRFEPQLSALDDETHAAINELVRERLRSSKESTLADPRPDSDTHNNLDQKLDKNLPIILETDQKDNFESKSSIKDPNTSNDQNDSELIYHTTLDYVPENIESKKPPHSADDIFENNTTEGKKCALNKDNVNEIIKSGNIGKDYQNITISKNLPEAILAESHEKTAPNSFHEKTVSNDSPKKNILVHSNVKLSTVDSQDGALSTDFKSLEDDQILSENNETDGRKPNKIVGLPQKRRPMNDLKTTSVQSPRRQSSRLRK